MINRSEIKKESRVKKTWLNARVNLIFYFLTLILSFFSRKIFLDYLGADFIGLTGTLLNLLGFLNLAELGIGSAIGYLLYRPLFDHNEEKITEIISVMGYLYRRIGLIILGAGLILACFIPWIFPDRNSHITLSLIYCAYFAFLGSSLIGYFINYRQNLLGADQRNYVVTAYFQSANIGKLIIQMISAYYTKNLYYWVAIEFVFGILYSIVLNIKINQTYPWLKANIRIGKSLLKKYPEVVTKTKQLFVHKIGGFFQYQSIPFLIYAFSSLSLVAFYQNYTTITSKINGLFSNMLTGLGASVGNLIAEGNKIKILNIFWELQSLRFFIAGLIVIPTYLLINPFIKIWLGQEYILSNLTLTLILIPILINTIRATVDEFNFGYGLFWDVWSPLLECVILLIISITLGSLYGLNGVLCGPIVSLIIIMIFWKPFMLFHWGFKKNPIIYWIEYLKNLGCLALSAVLTFYFTKLFDWDNIFSFIEWLIKAFFVVIFYLISSYLIFLLFTPGIKLLNNRIQAKIKSIRIFKKRIN